MKNMIAQMIERMNAEMKYFVIEPTKTEAMWSKIKANEAVAHTNHPDIHVVYRITIMNVLSPISEARMKKYELTNPATKL